MPRVRKYHAGTKSHTHKGDLDFTSKKGSKVHHLHHHNVRRSIAPFARGGYHIGTKSHTHKGDKDFTSKKGSKVHHIEHHDVRRRVAPFAGRKRKANGGFAFLPFLAPLIAGLASGGISYGTQKLLKKVAGGRRRKIH